MCRESINCDVESLWSAPPPIDVEAATDFSVTAELKELQKRMATLFLRQQQKGGIIDLEAEGVKMLVRTEDESSATTEGLNPPGTSLNTYTNQTVQPVNQMVSFCFSKMPHIFRNALYVYRMELEVKNILHFRLIFFLYKNTSFFTDINRRRFRHALDACILL